MALTYRCAHYVPAGAPQEIWFGRETRMALDGFFALVDDDGLTDGKELPRCRPCARQLALMTSSAEESQP